MFSYSRKSAQKYEIFLRNPIFVLDKYASHRKIAEKCRFFKKNVKKVAKKFGGNKKMRTFAIPNNKAVVVKW